MVTAVFALNAGSALAVTEIVCEPGAEGAVYRPVALMVPTELFPPALPSTDQVSTGLDRPCAEALNCCVAPGARTTPLGDTERLKTVTGELALADVELTFKPTVWAPAWDGAV